jgi:CHRD domain
MRKSFRVLVPLALASVPFALMASPAAAAGGQSFQATLNPLNHSTGSGMLTVTLNGNQATVDETFTGLAAKFNGSPFPHVQHIHFGGAGRCPTPSADKNNDGVVSTTEGGPAYGGIGTTLSVKGDTSPKAGTDIKIAPAGASTTYHRKITITPDVAKSIRSGNAVIVVHGLDPATLSKKAQGEKSDLVPSLPLAATSPALCGVVSSMPSGGVATGTGSTAGVEDLGALALGGGLLVAGFGGVAFVARRRKTAGI